MKSIIIRSLLGLFFLVCFSACYDDDDGYEKTKDKEEKVVEYRV